MTCRTTGGAVNTWSRVCVMPYLHTPSSQNTWLCQNAARPRICITARSCTQRHTAGSNSRLCRSDRHEPVKVCIEGGSTQQSASGNAQATPFILLCIALGVSDDSLRVPSVVGNNRPECLSLPVAGLTGKMSINQVLIFPEHSHKALPNRHCTTALTTHMGGVIWHEAENNSRSFP